MGTSMSGCVIAIETEIYLRFLKVGRNYDDHGSFVDSGIDVRRPLKGWKAGLRVGAVL